MSSLRPHVGSTSLAVLLLVFVVGAISAPGDVWGESEPLFRFSESPGPHPVGLKVVAQYDRSRTFADAIDDLGKPYRGERARPLQTLIWYPADQSKSRPMTMGDYLALMQTDIDFDHPKMPVKAKEWSSGFGPALAMTLHAIRDAPLSSGSGHFPVVIYAPGAGEPAWENVDLCEYLASYGYIVIAGPSLGAKSRTMTLDVAGANAQAADISFLIGYAQSLAKADTSTIAVVGMSWGGMANLFAAARDSRIKALVSLDGSQRYYPHVVQQAGDIHPEQMTIPLLAFVQHAFSIEDGDHYLSSEDRTGPNVLNEWTHGDLITVLMLELTHAQFNSLSQRNQDFSWELDHVYTLWRADFTRQDAMTGYAWVARYTLRFLDAYLKNDETAMAFLKGTPEGDRIPPHVLAVSYRPGSGTPACLETFRAELGRQGFARATEIYAEFRARDPKFDINEGVLMDWSDELLADNHSTEALILLKLNLKLHSDSSNAYRKLGDVYELVGQAQTAAEYYREAVIRDPLNADARRKLAQFSAH